MKPQFLNCSIEGAQRFVYWTGLEMWFGVEIKIMEETFNFD